MNAERLHIIALAIKDDLTAADTANVLDRIVQALRNQVSDPSEPSYQQTISENYEDLSKALSEAKSNIFNPTWKQVIQELGFEGLLGKKLLERVQEIFSRNQITTNIALAELSDILDDVRMKAVAIEQLVIGFNVLDIGAEELEQGQCEIGVLVPRACVENKLEDFSKELLELNKILNPFAELATHQREGFKINNISSSDFGISLDALPPIAACLAVAIERIVALYDKLLDIKKKHAELKALGLQERELKGIDDHANALMEKGIKELLPELMKKFWKGKDDGRKNELQIELQTALNKISNRIDRGFNIEIRVAPVVEDELTEKDKGTQEKIEHIKTIQAASRNIKFFKHEGTPLLSLPETDEGLKKKK